MNEDTTTSGTADDTAHATVTEQPHSPGLRVAVDYYRNRRRGPAELVALSGGISRKVLTQTLRRLQSNGLIAIDSGTPKRPHGWNTA